MSDIGEMVHCPRCGLGFVPDAKVAKPNDVPFVVSSDTSYEAAVSMMKAAPRQLARVFTRLRGCGPAGATDEEIELMAKAAGHTGRHQSISARRRTLVRMGMVYDSGQRRRGTSGRSQTVWIAREFVRVIG